MKRPKPSNGAPQRPQRGLLGSARQRPRMTRPIGPSLSSKAATQSSDSSGWPASRPAALCSWRAPIRCQNVSFSSAIRPP